MAAQRAVLLTGIFVLFLVRAAAQPPADWTVNPSDYEFSMTLIFTTSIDGRVGALIRRLANMIWLQRTMMDPAHTAVSKLALQK